MKCKICGKEFNEIHFLYGHENICSDECYHINFWNEIVAEKNKHIFIDGECYSIGDENSRSPFRGCGGRYFKIKLDNGQIIETTNLWCQGEVPEEYKDTLKNNAEFVYEG